MGKADADRDYYADLEVEPGAGANDIKKAFKRLGTVNVEWPWKAHADVISYSQL